jgi:hypothetical protein
LPRKAVKMDMTLAQRAVAFAAIVFLFLLMGFAIWAADPLRLATPSPNLVASTDGSQAIAVALRRHDGVDIRRTKRWFRYDVPDKQQTLTA